MKIKTKITFKEYLKLLFILTYSKLIMKIILSVDLLMLMWIIGYYYNVLPVPKPTYYQFTTVILITLIQPAVIFRTIKRNYESSNHLREPLEIELISDAIRMRGESFYTELIWEKIYKVVELKDWFLLYQNTLSAVLIPKRSFVENQEEEFKQILLAIPRLDLHLK